MPGFALGWSHRWIARLGLQLRRDFLSSWSSESSLIWWLHGVVGRRSTLASNVVCSGAELASNGRKNFLGRVDNYNFNISQKVFVKRSEDGASRQMLCYNAASFSSSSMKHLSCGQLTLGALRAEIRPGGRLPLLAAAVWQRLAGMDRVCDQGRRGGLIRVVRLHAKGAVSIIWLGVVERGQGSHGSCCRCRCCCGRSLAFDIGQRNRRRHGLGHRLAGNDSRPASLGRFAGRGHGGGRRASTSSLLLGRRARRKWAESLVLKSAGRRGAGSALDFQSPARQTWKTTLEASAKRHESRHGRLRWSMPEIVAVGERQKQRWRQWQWMGKGRQLKEEFVM